MTTLHSWHQDGDYLHSWVDVDVVASPEEETAEYRVYVIRATSHTNLETARKFAEGAMRSLALIHGHPFHECDTTVQDGTSHD